MSNRPYDEVRISRAGEPLRILTLGWVGPLTPISHIPADAIKMGKP